MRKKIAGCCILMLGCVGCAALGVTNEDSGMVNVASSITPPANGRVVVTFDRQPRTDAAARAYGREMGMNRSALSWFGLKSLAWKDAGEIRTDIGGDK